MISIVIIQVLPETVPSSFSEAGLGDGLSPPIPHAVGLGRVSPVPSSRQQHPWSQQHPLMEHRQDPYRRPRDTGARRSHRSNGSFHPWRSLWKRGYKCYRAIQQVRCIRSGLGQPSDGHHSAPTSLWPLPEHPKALQA